MSTDSEALDIVLPLVMAVSIDLVLSPLEVIQLDFNYYQTVGIVWIVRFSDSEQDWIEVIWIGSVLNSSLERAFVR